MRRPAPLRTAPALLLALSLLVALAGCGRDLQAAASAHEDRLRYVALGDSFTAGAGIPNVASARGCLRSDHNYPILVARQLGADLDDVSCSAATTESVAGSQETLTRENVAPQLDAVDRSADVITVSLGLNDLGFYTDPLISCLMQAAAGSPPATPCRTLGAPDAQGLIGRLPAVQAALEKALAAIRSRAPQAQVLLVGYPQPIPSQGGCDQLPITAQESADLHRLFVGLAVAMRTAAQRAGTGYVDVLTPSAGHDICAAGRAWINGPATIATALTFHPFVLEQEAIADLVVASVRR